MGTPRTMRAGVYGALAAALVLVVTAPGPVTSLRALRDAGSAEVASEPLVALLALLAWCLAAYLLTVAGLTAGSHLPGAAGRALRGLARGTAPAGLRRALETALGVTLVVGTLGTGTASAAGALPLPGLSAQTAPQAAHPAPVVAPDPAPAPSLDHPLASPAPSFDHPVSAASPTPSLDHPVTADARAVTPTAAPATGAPATAAASARAQVVVAPGDSLWSIAEGQLEARTGRQASDAQVAQAWPSWWQANREAVGDDPDLLHPGTHLVPPTDS